LNETRPNILRTDHDFAIPFLHGNYALETENGVEVLVYKYMFRGEESKETKVTTVVCQQEGTWPNDEMLNKEYQGWVEQQEKQWPCSETTHDKVFVTFVVPVQVTPAAE